MTKAELQTKIKDLNKTLKDIGKKIDSENGKIDTLMCKLEDLGRLNDELDVKHWKVKDELKNLEDSLAKNGKKSDNVVGRKTTKTKTTKRSKK